MTLRHLLWAACLALALLSLAAAFVLYGGSLGPVRWLGAGVVLALILGLSLGIRTSEMALPLACLVGLVVMGATSLLLGAPLYLAAPGVVAALGASDLANPPVGLSSGSSSASNCRHERVHVLWLGLVLGMGLLLVASGSVISLDIPFLPLLLFVLLALFCLDRAFRRVKGG